MCVKHTLSVYAYAVKACNTRLKCVPIKVRPSMQSSLLRGSNLNSFVLKEMSALSR